MSRPAKRNEQERFSDIIDGLARAPKDGREIDNLRRLSRLLWPYLDTWQQDQFFKDKDLRQIERRAKRWSAGK